MNEIKKDPLATLRIDRSSESNSSSTSAKFFNRLLVVVIILLLGGGGYFYWKSQTSDGSGNWAAMTELLQKRPEFRVSRVSVEKGRSADATVVATGYLKSRRQAKIGARAPGRIEVVNVEEGSPVEKNQILAVLEHADLDAGLAATRATLSRSKAAVREQEVLIDQANLEFKRMQALHKSNSISDAEFDLSRFQQESAVARLSSVKADVELAEARLKEAEQLKENMFIRAPFDGTVISKDAEVGESILPGGMGEASGRGSVVTIADLQNLEVDCDVKEDYISRISAGQAAEVAVDAVPDRRYRGAVRKVIPMGDRARATIKVEVSILDADKRLFPDMSGTVYFLPAENEAARENDKERLFCPANAIDRQADGDRVWVVDSESKVHPRTVTAGQEKDGRVEILSGLNGDERVVLEPKDLVADKLIKVSD
jgi:RND family efflux transporter MFP subunit